MNERFVKEERMNIRFRSAKASGQSIPFIALIIVILFAMVGLAVDVGNTYAEQRSAVRAANAAALAGMNTLIKNGTDKDIGEVIVNSLASNKIKVASNDTGLTSDTRKMEAYYLGADGNLLATCYIGKCGTVPNGVTYIQVRLDGFTDTYFARVVGRNTLPVKTQSFAAQCPPMQNVYPIGIRSKYLDAKGFVAPTDPDEAQYYGRYNDEFYSNRWQRRIYLKDNSGASGGFSYLRWLSGTTNGNATALAGMLTGDGNLENGFEEAPWPSGIAGKPDGYAIRPGQLSPGDWVHGNTGYSTSNAVKAALNTHIARRTVMILPILDDETWGNGNTATFHIERFGTFLLRSYGHQSKGHYMDLVYLDDADPIACNLTNVPTRVDQLSVKGAAFVRPQHQDIPEVRQPIEYVMVLDTSGSMSWNFAGQAKNGSKTLQCTYNSANPTAKVIDCGSNVWPTENERRIYLAKQAITQFIDGMEQYDAMQIIGYTGNTYPVKMTGTRQLGTPTGKDALKTAVRDAGKVNGNPYLTKGGTPSASALRSARELIVKTPKTAPNGLEYKKVVIFLTDGVANHFVEKVNVPWGKNQWYNSAKDDAKCANDNNVGENVSCQRGYVAGGDIPRPLTAMAREGQQLQSTATVYVMMMGGADQTGLSEVASQASFPWYTTALNGTQVKDILMAIQGNAEAGDCQPVKGEFLDAIESGNTPEHAELGGEIVGYVLLYDKDGNPLPSGQHQVPITHDPVTGKLTYAVTGLVPGTYQFEAWVGYKGEDGVTRVYSRIFDPATLEYVSRVTWPVQPSNTLNDTVPGPRFHLDLNGLVCPVTP